MLAFRADEVSAAQRQGAKAVNFGRSTASARARCAENAFDTYGIDMTVAEARVALDRFFLTYRTLKRWMYNHADLCQRRGYVEIGCGRVVEAKWEPEGRLSFPQCCNLPVQGAAADAMLRALAMVFRRLRGLSGGLVACVHDELVLEVVEADAEMAGRILAETMTEAFELTFPGAPTGGVVALGTGPNLERGEGMRRVLTAGGAHSTHTGRRVAARGRRSQSQCLTPLSDTFPVDRCSAGMVTLRALRRQSPAIHLRQDTRTPARCREMIP